MKLYRLCCPEEIKAIETDSPQKLTFGRAMFRFAGLNKNNLCNDFDIYKSLMESLKNVGNDRETCLKSILKVFPNLPNEIPVFEPDMQKRRNLCKKFTPNCSYELEEKTSPYISPESYNVLHEPDEKFDEIFLYTIKIACFFDKMENIRSCFTKLSSENNNCIMTIDFPEKIALQYAGKGYYPNFNAVEYALPMYMLESKHILQVHQLEDSEINEYRQEYFIKTSNYLKNLIKSNKSEGEEVKIFKSDAELSFK